MAQSLSLIPKEPTQMDMLDFFEGRKKRLPKTLKKTVRKRAERPYAYLLRYENIKSKRLHSMEVLILIKAQHPAKASSLVSVSRNAIRTSDFVPHNPQTRKSFQRDSSLFE